MKSLREYSLNLPEQEYHDLPYWCYSKIAKYAKEGFTSLYKLSEKTAPSPSMEFGSLFDSIMTRGMQTLEDYVVDETSCPPKEKEVFDWLLSHGHRESFEAISTTYIDAAIENCRFYQNIKPETRLAKLSNAAAYYDIRRTGKKIVSKQDWQDAMDMYDAFKKSPYLRELFRRKDTDDVEFIYQAQFVVDWWIADECVKVKIMPDLMIVDHRNRTIQLVDLKTSTMPGFQFSENFLKFRYDLQGEIYTDVIVKLISEIPEYNDYIVLPYLFTDISRSDKIPVTYQIDLSNGFSFTKGDKTYEYRGWKDILEEILVYAANEAKVPDYITLDGPNDLISILERQ